MRRSRYAQGASDLTLYTTPEKKKKERNKMNASSRYPNPVAEVKKLIGVNFGPDAVERFAKLLTVLSDPVIQRALASDILDDPTKMVLFRRGSFNIEIGKDLIPELPPELVARYVEWQQQELRILSGLTDSELQRMLEEARQYSDEIELRAERQ